MDPEPRLSPEVQKLFANFVALAHKSAQQTFDCEYFYEFIWHCYVHEAEVGEDTIGGDDVQQLLALAGFTDEKVRYFADVFQHGMGLMRFVAKW